MADRDEPMLSGVGHGAGSHEAELTEALRDAREAFDAKSQEAARLVALLRATFESTEDAILVTDHRGNITDFNRQFLQLWGLSEDQVAGQSHLSVQQRNAARLIDGAGFLARSQSIYASTGPFFDELQLIDGRVVERFSTPQFVDGQPAARLWSYRDATDRRRAEELRLHMSAIVESANDAVISETLDGTITTWNRGAEEIFRYTAAEAIGRSIAMLVPADRFDEEAQLLAQLKTGGRIDHYETERLRKDGSRVYVALTVSPVQDAQGRVVGASKIARDITEQKLAEETRSRLAAVIESSEDAIITKDLNSIITSWNASATRIFGYTAEEAIGKSVTILFPADRYDEEQAILQRIRNGERIQHYQAERVRKDGTKIDISLSVSPIKDHRGTIVGASKIARDITPQRQRDLALESSERRLRAVLDATPDCVKIVDGDGALLFMNQAGLGMIESPSLGEVRGACVFELVSAEHRPAWIDHHRRVCNGERLNWEFEITGLQGARRWMETHAVPLVQSDGQTVHLAVTREITARKHSEQEREELLISERAARSDAEHASRLKDEFLATLSHELRTPLNAILGWAQVLSSHRGKVDIEEGLEVIQRNARAQAKLIDDLLDMSRIISGKVRLDVQWTELATVIDAAVASVQPSAEAKSIRLRKIVDPLAGPVSGDPTRLQQVVWNLLTNAIKFTPKGGSVDVLLERVNSHLEITVHDSGIGIAPEFLPQVFERFRQADSSTTRAYGGLGLGLSIVKHIVELHGGTVSVKSSGENLGATFIVCLPLAPVRADERREHPASSKAGPFDHSHVDLEGVKVLIVDDERDARTLIARLLTQCKADVRMAGSVDEGLALLTEYQPDVLISDIGMPGKDGYQFMREVRKLTAEQGGRVPAIALTAFARSEDRTRAMLAGYQVHVSKPIEPQELLATVGSLAGRTGS